MRKTWIIVIILGVVPIAVAILSFFYQKEMVDFFTQLGWLKIVSFISGPWWNNSIPTLILMWGVGVAVWQIREGTKGTNAQIAVELFRELRAKETIKILRLIYGLKPDDIENLSTFNKSQINRVLDKFEIIGALVNKHILNESLAIEVFAGPPALRCWYQLVEYIRKENELRGFFIKHYEVFVRTTIEYFRDKGIEVNLRLIWLNDPIPLVKTFYEWGDNKDHRWPKNLKEIERETKHNNNKT